MVAKENEEIYQYAKVAEGKCNEENYKLSTNVRAMQATVNQLKEQNDRANKEVQAKTQNLAEALANVKKANEKIGQIELQLEEAKKAVKENTVAVVKE